MNLKNLPELNFATADAEELLAKAQTICEGILGRNLERADPLLLFLKSLVAIILQQTLLIDELAKQNLLAYAKNSALEHIGALVGVERLAASKATTTCKVTLSAALNKAVTIKKGTRVNAGDEINFAMDDDLIFLAGEVEKSAAFTCVEIGTVGNGYPVGKLNKVVDPQPFLLSIENETASDGGADLESDDDLRERIAIAPERFSTAGSFGAYEYFAKQASNLVSDVFVTSENPGEVDIYILQEGGAMPTAEVKKIVEDALTDRKVRPLTDNLFVKSPEIVNFDIDLIYYISSSDAASAATIKAKVDAAIEDFILWQRLEIGRDINKTELEYRIRAAGAKRVEISAPTNSPVEDNQIAICENVNVVYAGLEKN